MLHQAEGKALRDSSIPHHMEDIAPVGKSLCMGITTESEAVRSHDDNTSGILIDVTVANPMAIRHIVSSTRRGGHTFHTAQTRREQTYRGYSDPTYYTLANLAFSTATYGDIGDGTVGFYRTVATHRVLKKGT